MPPDIDAAGKYGDQTASASRGPRPDRVGLDLGRVVAPADDSFTDRLSFKSLGVDVHQGQGGILQEGKVRTSDQAAGEPLAANTDKSDFGHDKPPFSVRVVS